MAAEEYDAIVLGLGGMGSAAIYHLARRGCRVLGLDRFGPAHENGSSHGETRVIRKAYFEAPEYVPLLQRAYQLWDQLEREIDQPLLIRSGCAMISHEKSPVVQGAIASARRFNLEHEVWNFDALSRRLSPFEPDPGMIAVYEPGGGYLLVEECVRAHLNLAKAAGAELRFRTPVTAIRNDESGVTVFAGNAKMRAERLVVCAGAWSGSLFANLDLPLSPRRVVQHWFEPERASGKESEPVFFCEGKDGAWFYGVPPRGRDQPYWKFAFHNRHTPCDPDTVERAVFDSEIRELRETVEKYRPGLIGDVRKSKVCLYTMTPDEHFAVGFHPTAPAILLAAGFSGHGFKFASVIGEILADLTKDGKTEHPIAFLDPRRFQEGAETKGSKTF